MMSSKIKIVYLLALILFCIGIFLYLLDSWQILNIENFLPSLSKKAPLVSQNTDAPTELEWKRLEKDQDKLERQRIELEEELARIQKEKKVLNTREEELGEKIDGFEKEKKNFENAKNNYRARQKNIEDMAARLQAMPPQEAVEIVSNWNNNDLVSVLLQMEKNSEIAGEASIVPYLLTLVSRERAALLMTLMLEEKGE